MKSLMDLHSNLREKEEDATIIAEGYMAEQGVGRIGERGCYED